MITAKFGNKKFEVSRRKVYTPIDLSFGESIETEEVEKAGAKPNLNIKGIGLKTLSFNVMLDSRFVNIENEIIDWQRILLTKKSEVFYLGKNSLGRFFLTNVDASNINISKNGTYTKASIALSFIEDGNTASSLPPKPPKVEQVINSNSSNASKKVYVGMVVKPKSNTRWYETAEGALKRTGKSGKAYNKNMSVRYIYKNGKAINLEGLGWMIPTDVNEVIS